MAIARELGNKIAISNSLDGFAALAARRGEAKRAARLAGAAERLREQIGYEIEPAECRFRDAYLAELKTKMDEADFARLYEQGRKLKLEEAVALCLEENDGKIQTIVDKPFAERLEKSHLSGTENATGILQATTGDANKTTAETSYSFARQIKRLKPLAAVALVVLPAAIGLGVWQFGVRPAETKQGANTKQIESIAVMPLVNESGNADVEYLSDGMTETLIGALSQLSNLNVKARSAVFRYKGKATDAQTIGKELNVQTILTGRVAQRGDDLTLSLSLEDVRTGNQIWGKQYNRKLTGIIGLQTEIARDVSANLKPKLSGADERRLAKNYTVNPEAYQLYLKGRDHAGRFTPSEMQRAISFYQQAIELDPNYALAYVKLSNAYINLALSSEIPAPEVMPQAKAAANRAIEIDDSLAEAHEGLSTISYWYDWDLNAAEKHVKRALELNPNSASIQMEYAGVLSNTGRHAESIPVIRRALDLDPQNQGYQSLEGLFLIRARQYDEGLAVLQKVRERSPSLLGGYLFAIPGYTEQGKFTEALALARQAREIAGRQPQAMSFLGQTLAIAGKPDEARAVLEEMLKLSKERHVSPYNIAMVYNALEEREETFAQLERAYELREPRMVMLSMERKWDNLRSDPRFQHLLRRVGLPQ